MNMTRGLTIAFLFATFLLLVIGSRYTLAVLDAVNTGAVPVASAASAMQWVGWALLAWLVVPVLIGSVAVYREAARLRRRTGGRG